MTISSKKLARDATTDSVLQNPTFCSLKTEEWMNTEEAAQYLRLSVGALRNLTSNGKVPYHKLGNRNRYLLDDLRKLLLANKRGAFNYE